MKFISRPTIDDAVLLNQIAADPGRKLRRFPNDIPSILAHYQRYVEVKGNAADVNAPTPLALPAPLKTLLKGYYARSENELSFIENLRSSSTDACPMCGGTNSSTIDHIFPQGTFAEFAFFSWNLVPACGCNTKRGEAYLGENPGERVLHPYFDECLKERLIRADIVALDGNFKLPQISLHICMLPTDLMRPALDFHVKNIVKKTFILRHLTHLWTKIMRGPEHYFTLPSGVISMADMDVAVTAKLASSDDHLGTPNNWDSIFFAGIEANALAKQFLVERVVNLRRLGKTRSDDI